MYQKEYFDPDEEEIYALKSEADTDHHHNALYAPLVHNHDTVYALKSESATDHNHNSQYAQLVHNHDNVYALKSESATDHNHNSQYAPLVHNHDSVYIKIEDVAGAVDLTPYALKSESASDHNHDSVYTTLNTVIYWCNILYATSYHNHDTVYAKIGDVNGDGTVNLDLTPYALVANAATDHNHNTQYAPLVRPWFRTNGGDQELNQGVKNGLLIFQNNVAGSFTLTQIPVPSSFGSFLEPDHSGWETPEWITYLDTTPFEVHVFNNNTTTNIQIRAPPARADITFLSARVLPFNLAPQQLVVIKQIVRIATGFNHTNLNQTVEYIFMVS